MSSDTWAALINKYYVFDSDLSFTGKELLASINAQKQRHLQSQMDHKTNMPIDHVGIFREKHRFKGKSSYSWFFYATTKGSSPLKTEKKWFECIVHAEELLNKVITRKESTETKNTTKNLLETYRPSSPSKKRKLSSPVRLRTSEKQQPFEDSPSSCTKASISSSVHHCPCTTTIPSMPYWDSPEARKLFRAHDNEDTQQSLRIQIEELMKANETESSYVEVIQDGEKMEEDTLTAYEKHLIHQKSQLLCISLHLALENMNKWTWNQCCREAIEMAKKMGVTATKNPKTIEKWYRNFREKRKFCVPLKAKHNLPPFLELNPDVFRAMKEYATSNLATLSVEMMSEYIHHVVLPQMIENEVKESNRELDQENAREKILKQYGLTKICLSTVYKWIKKLGFNYEPRKKGYYVDGHEKEETVSYRWRYIERYLQYEQRMFRWIQITEEEAKHLEDKGTIKKGRWIPIQSARNRTGDGGVSCRYL